MKNKIGLVTSVLIVMSPLLIFSFIQLMNSFNTEQILLGITAFMCSLGAFILVLKSFGLKKQKS